MQYFPMNYLMNMETLPKVDRRILAYGAVWAVAIAAGVIWLVA